MILIIQKKSTKKISSLLKKFLRRLNELCTIVHTVETLLMTSSISYR